MSISKMALSRRYGEISNHSNGSINIYLTVDGSVIPMRISESDSIASVKLRIQASKGFFVRKQKLVFEGRELARNDSCFRDYGVLDGKTLHLVIKISDLQAITVRTVCGKELEFHVQRNRNVGYVKEQIAKRDKSSLLDLGHQELVCEGEELEDKRLVDDISKSSSDAVIHLLVRSSAKVRAKPIHRDLELSIERSDFSADKNDSAKEFEHSSRFSRLEIADKRDFLVEPVNRGLSSALKELIEATRSGVEKGNKPIKSREGMGGTYFMQDSTGTSYVSVFKPVDEEPNAENNPNQLVRSVDGQGLKKGTRAGEGAAREVAAFVLDHPRSGDDDEKGFAGVPPTVMIECCLPREEEDEKKKQIGSLQRYVENDGSCEEMGPRDFPVEDVHRISVLDIRLANADRHAGNILVRRDGKTGRVSLVPIDHGYCLPEIFEDCTFDWLNWPQSREPYSRECTDYIRSLDAELDIRLLKLHGWDPPPECARNLRVSTMLLKKGAERGLTPFAIGNLMCRKHVNEESTIEQILREADQRGTGEAEFLDTVSSIMDRCMDELLMEDRG